MLTSYSYIYDIDLALSSLGAAWKIMLTQFRQSEYDPANQLCETINGIGGRIRCRPLFSATYQARQALRRALRMARMEAMSLRKENDCLPLRRRRVSCTVHYTVHTMQLTCSRTFLPPLELQRTFLTFGGIVHRHRHHI